MDSLQLTWIHQQELGSADGPTDEDVLPPETVGHVAKNHAKFVVGIYAKVII